MAEGMGSLLVTCASRLLALPLEAVRFDTVVTDQVASVAMVQRFWNPHNEPLEALYVFPLPGSAAVRAFVLTSGGRRMAAQVVEREAASATYREAVDKGQQAARLEQERDGVFSVQVGCIAANETVEVTLEWTQCLPFFDDGTVELRLPLVVAPRYCEASNLPPIVSPKPVRALAVSGRIPGAVAHRCSHPVTISDESVSHEDPDAVFNRDFVLSWRSSVRTMRCHVLAGPAGDGSLPCMITLVPPTDLPQASLPRDVVFLLDRSGSMAGAKMTSATKAVKSLIGTLGPRERYAVAGFSQTVEWLPRRGWMTTQEDVVLDPKADGGTELEPALNQALSLLHDRDSERNGYLVLITDGQVANEEAILRLAQTCRDAVRIYAIGIDDAVNEAFLRRLAAVGRGTATLVTPGELLEEAMQQVARDIGVPLVTDLRLEDIDCGVEPGSVTPSRIPDLFAGRPVTILARVRRPGTVRLMGSPSFSIEVSCQPGGPESLSHMWARSRVMDLEDAFRQSGRTTRLRNEIVALAVRYKILTQFTAFVVVDMDGRRQVRPRLRAMVPRAVPSGWHGSGVIAVELLPSEKRGPSLGQFLRELLAWLLRLLRR